MDRTYHLAELNVGRLNHALDAAESAEFVAALEPINAIAESTPGFVWRLKDDSGASSSYVPLEGNDDPLLIVNYSVWTDLDSFKHFLHKSGHGAYLRRRREWFQPSDVITTVCWWTPAGEIPPLADAHRRLLQLRAEGPSHHGWPLSKPIDPPS